MARKAAATGLAAAFRHHLGPDALQRLHFCVTKKPVVVIAGDQLTGKSTVAKRIAAAHPGSLFWSTGASFRAEAARRGISVAMLSKQLQDDPSVDVAVDHSVCEVIGGAAISEPSLVVEGRMPALNAALMSTEYDKENVVALYLQCSPWERALRFLEREISPAASEYAEAHLEKKQYETLEAVATDIQNLDLPNINAVMDAFVSNAQRDEDDARRYQQIYGCDYQEPLLYDAVINVDQRCREVNFSKVVASLRQFGGGHWFVDNPR